MRQFARTAVIFSLLSVFSSVARAGDSLYLIGAIGASDASAVAGTVSGRFRDISGDDTGFSLGIGHAIGSVFSVEASYQSYGDLSGTRNRCAGTVCTLEWYAPETNARDTASPCSSGN